VVVFPEGTRSYDGQLQPPERGISLLAHRSGVPVVPAYISGTHDVLPRGGGMIHFHPVSVSFGPPLRFDNESLKQGGRNAYHAFSLQVMAAIARLKASRDASIVRNSTRSSRSTDC
jgi:1-acyl-sn-glycerol-3-phosphate acyltransferase